MTIRTRGDVAPGWTWGQLAKNRFWLIVPILALDLALVGSCRRRWHQEAPGRTSLAGCL